MHIKSSNVVVSLRVLMVARRQAGGGEGEAAGPCIIDVQVLVELLLSPRVHEWNNGGC